METRTLENKYGAWKYTVGGTITKYRPPVSKIVDGKKVYSKMKYVEIPKEVVYRTEEKLLLER